MKTFSFALALLGVLAVTALSGCGNKRLMNATGRLTYKGQPVPSTYLTFWPEGEGLRRSTGLTDDEGNFTLKYSRNEYGVVPGKHTVFLRYFADSSEEKAPPKASRELKAVIARYGDLKTSPLHYEITQNGQFLDIKLE